MFIALLPDEGVRDEFATWRDRWSWPRSATLVKSTRLHMTVHFLGDVPLAQIPDLNAPVTPFSLHFGRAALWPHGIAVLEPEAVPAPLVALHAALAANLRSAGLPVDERALRAHVTLARRANGALAPEAAPQVVWNIDRYHLMSSAQDADGAYTTLRTYG